MKLFVILSRFPFPLEKGDKLRAYYQLKELSKKNEIILCCLSDKAVKEEWKTEIRKYCQQLHIFELGKTKVYTNTALQAFSSKPFQVGYFYQSGIQRKIDQIIRIEKPDHIYCQLIRTAEYVKHHHNIPKTIDYMDALGKGMLRRAEISSGIKRFLFRAEGKRLSQYENRIFDYFNHHTIISAQDRKYINHPDQDKIVIIENGISSDFFNGPTGVTPEYELVFTGNMNYPPNIECALFIANEILPKLKSKFPQIRLLLSGANPNPKIAELNKRPDITVSGWVDDIRTSYANGKIFLAPLFIGTGLQNKLLEAMAMGLPCITTPLANNALKAIPGKSILLADHADSFAEKVTDLLTDHDLSKEIANGGQSFVKEHFSWEKSVEKLNTLFGS